MKDCVPKRKRNRTWGDFAAALGKSFLDLMESDWDGIELSKYFDCETLGRFACVSRRTLAMNKTSSGLVARWYATANALDKLFPLIHDYGSFSYNSEKGADQWEAEAGGDPRYSFIFPAIKQCCSPEDDAVTRDAWNAGELAWKGV